MSIRFTQLEQQAVPFTSMIETPRAYCDDLYRMAKLAFLNMMMNLVAGNPALLSQGQNFDSGNSIAQIPAVITTSSEALQEPISIQPMNTITNTLKCL
ncbi:TPA: hypothetical protein QCG03_003511 [Enterobacter bugandensis]|uniref:hypothetical protein n=1 Tax=Enterobacter bugandensis TaxID=881260 RepID=UPI0007B3F11A|nr:hypothetical protein [Enterobacter bugandensis]KZP58803.1 hypothetical protein A3462_17880 [Enterobacter bugandensis]MCK6750374.1 hypothetical protein [Enterobacter bugandensis]MCK6763653.1 hypothetical protein [Enterobacter bugandensis]HAS1474273.1 hypothetical protein [Enterobacter bugandensis]HDR2050524.1 hypothetical protein [Enterobacter bugandensis]